MQRAIKFGFSLDRENLYTAMPEFVGENLLKAKGHPLTERASKKIINL